MDLVEFVDGLDMGYEGMRELKDGSKDFFGLSKENEKEHLMQEHVWREI